MAVGWRPPFLGRGIPTQVPRVSSQLTAGSLQPLVREPRGVARRFSDLHLGSRQSSAIACSLRVKKVAHAERLVPAVGRK